MNHLEKLMKMNFKITIDTICEYELKRPKFVIFSTPNLSKNVAIMNMHIVLSLYERRIGVQ
ncbi:hypothetical protein C0J52_07435 [Blattella germanica]|nr:hypothetical protein C0J52_07435 [Blattella germanica]